MKTTEVCNQTKETGVLRSRHVTWRGKGSEFFLPGIVVVAAGVVVVSAGVVVVAAGVVVVAAGVVVVAAGVVVVSAFAHKVHNHNDRYLEAFRGADQLQQSPTNFPLRAHPTVVQCKHCSKLVRR